ncbi:SEC-C metal-binding domain-containing protein [Sphingobium sp. Cam5-1]|uniref:SEC-C metal-binding domain-containing protein n=2 Tax=Sphingomonadaceae TaxID=41297 RepID=UPI003FA7A9EE
MWLRKYRTRSSAWYGLSLSPNDGRIRTGKKVEFPWARDEEFERQGERLGINLSLERPAKLGRNDPCYCGSGKKYKKCHLGSG